MVNGYVHSDVFIQQHRLGDYEVGFCMGVPLGIDPRTVTVYPQQQHFCVGDVLRAGGKEALSALGRVNGPAYRNGPPVTRPTPTARILPTDLDGIDREKPMAVKDPGNHLQHG